MPVLSSISRETDEHGFLRSEKFVTERGFELSIEPTPGGLYTIIPHGGGAAPRVCEERFTSHLKAREALSAYVAATDKLGFAEYPGKDPAKVRKPKRDSVNVAEQGE